MARRMLEERGIEGEVVGGAAKPGAERSVTLDRLERPLGWLRARAYWRAAI